MLGYLPNHTKSMEIARKLSYGFAQEWGMPTLSFSGKMVISIDELSNLFLFLDKPRNRACACAKRISNEADSDMAPWAIPPMRHKMWHKMWLTYLNKKQTLLVILLVKVVGWHHGEKKKASPPGSQVSPGLHVSVTML